MRATATSKTMSTRLTLMSTNETLALSAKPRENRSVVNAKQDTPSTNTNLLADEPRAPKKVIVATRVP
ncbi:MAG TPA: hypothetical protein VF088_01770 [Pyrinomonadaceae bacterium]